MIEDEKVVFTKDCVKSVTSDFVASILYKQYPILDKDKAIKMNKKKKYKTSQNKWEIQGKVSRQVKKLYEWTEKKIIRTIQFNWRQYPGLQGGFILWWFVCQLSWVTNL